MSGFYSRSAILLVFSFLLGAVRAEAIEIWRNQSRYEIDLRIPAGASLQKKGVDRVIVAGRIEANLRLIQDNYSSCDLLIEERQNNRRKDGFSVALNKTAKRSECAIVLRNPTTDVEMASHYVWLEACRCYAAVHFTYPTSARKQLPALSGPILSSLRGKREQKAQTSGDAIEDDGLDANWKAAIAIYKKRGFPARAAYQFYMDSFDWTGDSGNFDKRMKAYIAKVFSIPEDHSSFDDTPSGDWIYDLETGKFYPDMSPQDMARTISKCYAAKEYWKSCQLNYHQEMGCRMTKNWRTVCRQNDAAGTSKFNINIGDLCFWEPKGDLPMLAAADTSERSVELPDAAPKVSSRKRKSKPPAKKAVPYCTEEHWPEVFGKL